MVVEATAVVEAAATVVVVVAEAAEAEAVVVVVVAEAEAAEPWPARRIHALTHVTPRIRTKSRTKRATPPVRARPA